MITAPRTLLCVATVSAFVACDERPVTTGEKIEHNVDDALDRRPAEKVRDAAEDTKEAAKEAAN